jgi:hypothetical protein
MGRPAQGVTLFLIGACIGAAIAACEKHPVFATGENQDYGACGVCFTAPPRTLFRAKDLTPGNSCAFRFRGQGIAVDGEHSGFVPTPQKKDGYTEQPGGAVRSRYESNGQIVESIFMARDGNMPNLILTVTYEDRGLRKMADDILSSARRCATGVTNVTR